MPRPAVNLNSGFACPNCQVGKAHVKDSRQNIEGGVKRRRECPMCSYRFTTVEFIGLDPPKKEEKETTKILKKLLPKLYVVADLIDLLKAEH